MDTAAPGYLVDDSRWTKLHNMRPFRGATQQLPKKVIAGRIIAAGAADLSPFLLTASIATKNRDEALLFALTSNQARQLRPASSWVGLTLNHNGTSSVSNPFNTVSGQYRRWAHCMYMDQIWFTNDFNVVKYSDGTKVENYTGVDLPQGRYIESFFDRLVVGNYTFKGDNRPNGIISSDLYDPSDWVTRAENEACKIDFEEFALADYPLAGLTGLKRMNNLLVAYLPTAIVGLQYVGLPKVYQWNPITENRGNSLMYGLAAHGSMHFFFDGVEQDFVMFGEGGFQSIGERIVSHFGSTLSTDFDLQQRTWAFCWREYQEVWWVYCSAASTGEFDSAVVFNWRSKEWYTADVSDLQCFGGRAKRAKTCDELTGTCNALTDICNDLSDASEAVTPRFWGNSVAQVLREEVAADADVDTLALGVPELITKDETYGDYDSVKEVDAVRLDASYSSGCTGIDVYLSARRYNSDPVVFVKVGTWTEGIKEGRLTFAGVSGCLFRWKFVPVGPHVRNLVWSVTVDSVYNGKADK